MIFIKNISILLIFNLLLSSVGIVASYHYCPTSDVKSYFSDPCEVVDDCHTSIESVEPRCCDSNSESDNVINNMTHLIDLQEVDECCVELTEVFTLELEANLINTLEFSLPTYTNQSFITDYDLSLDQHIVNEFEFSSSPPLFSYTPINYAITLRRSQLPHSLT